MKKKQEKVLHTFQGKPLAAGPLVDRGVHRDGGQLHPLHHPSSKEQGMVSWSIFLDIYNLIEIFLT